MPPVNIADSGDWSQGVNHITSLRGRVNRSQPGCSLLLCGSCALFWLVFSFLFPSFLFSLPTPPAPTLLSVLIRSSHRHIISSLINLFLAAPNGSIHPSFYFPHSLNSSPLIQARPSSWAPYSQNQKRRTASRSPQDPHHHSIVGVPVLPPSPQLHIVHLSIADKPQLPAHQLYRERRVSTTAP